MSQECSDIVSVLLSYQKLSKDTNNHVRLLKDKTVILYCATLLENKNSEIINLCLDILEDFIHNKRLHSALLNTFGLYESLDNLSIRSRSLDEKIANRTADLVKELKNNAPPAFGTRSKKWNPKNAKNAATIYHLYIPDVTEENRIFLDEVLVSILGMISFVVDVDQKRCTLRLTPCRSPMQKLQAVVVKIVEKANMSAMLISKDASNGSEKLIDLLQNQSVNSTLENSEEEDCSKNKALNYFTKVSQNAGDFIKNAADFWNRSFYW